MTDTPTLYELLPAYFRRRDAQQGYPLKALFDLLETEGADVVSADLDAFHDGLFIETAPEERLTDIGRLIGAPPLKPLPAGSGSSLRALIGNLLRYRRAKGTPVALERVARDVTLYSAKVIEYYSKLAATPSLMAPRLDRKTTAALREPGLASRIGTAFDPTPRTPDMRSIARANGRYNIPNIGLHLWRLDIQPFEGWRGAAIARFRLAKSLPLFSWDNYPDHFAIAPFGKEVPLFMPQQNDDRHSPLRHEVPERLQRLPLKSEIDAIAAGTLREGESLFFNPDRPAFRLYARLHGDNVFQEVPVAAIRIGKLTAPPYSRFLPAGVFAALDPVTGRVVTRTADIASGIEVVEELRLSCALGLAGPIGGGSYDRNDFESPYAIRHDDTVVYVVDPDPQPPAPPAVIILPTLDAALAAWRTAGNAGRRGIIIVTANSALEGNGNVEVTLPAGCDLTIVAADWQPGADHLPGEPDLLPRGYIVRRMSLCAAARGFNVSAAVGPNSAPSALTLDGLHCHGGVTIAADSLSRLSLRHCTLFDHGASPSLMVQAGSTPIDLDLDRSVVGGIQAADALKHFEAKNTVLAGSVLCDLSGATLDLAGITAFAAIKARSINASDCLFLADVSVDRTQQGCVRYSYLGGTSNRLPRRYRCQPDLSWENVKQRYAAADAAEQTRRKESLRVSLAPRFLDTAIASPGFALLTLDTPPEIRRGGEDDQEMGAFAFMGGSIRIANLESLMADFVPLGMEAVPIAEDRSQVEARRRNKP